MGVIKDRHGTYCARQKVPMRLQEAVARILENGKAKQAYLKRSLGTKDLREANIRAKPVLMEFDKIIARAEERLKVRPLRTSLSAVEIKRLGEYVYASSLARHDKYLVEATRMEAEMRKEWEEEEGPQEWVEQAPKYGLSGGQMFEAAEEMPRIIKDAEEALARGNIEHHPGIAYIAAEAFEALQINLDPACPDYRRAALEIMRAHVRALRAWAARFNGEPIETPPLIEPTQEAAPATGTLRDALTGWQKERSPSRGVLAEYERAVRLFTELHGDIPVAHIKRSHARLFREALQDLPRHRPNKLRHIPLPGLAEWGREHPEAQKIRTATVNKLFGGVQTIACWAYTNGLISDDVAWSDPFHKMRLEEPGSDRDAFTIDDLNILFATPVFTKGERPSPGKGEAAYWLPLISLFTGARLSEIAMLTVKDVQELEGTLCFSFVEDKTRGKRLKTRTSARTVPVHQELSRLSLRDHVETLRRKGSEHAWLFPEISPDRPGAQRAWSKWFNRNLRAIGITDRRKVFHSFRHTFKDALRAARIPEDLNDALTGHSNKSVGRGYGAKEIVRRFGMPALKDAIASVRYEGLQVPKANVELAKKQTRNADYVQ